MATGEWASSDGEDFAPGAEITILAGYDEAEEVVFSGLVVKVGVRIAGNNDSRLVVDCRDKAVRMTLGRHNANYIDMSDSDVMQQAGRRPRPRKRCREHRHHAQGAGPVRLHRLGLHGRARRAQRPAGHRGRRQGGGEGPRDLGRAGAGGRVRRRPHRLPCRHGRPQPVQGGDGRGLGSCGAGHRAGRLLLACHAERAGRPRWREARQGGRAGEDQAARGQPARRRNAEDMRARPISSRRGSRESAGTCDSREVPRRCPAP